MANSLTAYSSRDDNHPSMVEVSHCRQSILPGERSEKSFHGKQNQTCTFRCRIASARPYRVWKWKRLANSCSNSPCGRCSPRPLHAPRLGGLLPKPCRTTMKKRHSKRHTTFCLFVSNVHSRRNRIHPTPADDRLFAASQSVAFLVHSPDDANLSLSPDRYHQQLQACCIAVLSNWGILCRGGFQKQTSPQAQWHGQKSSVWCHYPNGPRTTHCSDTDVCR